MSGVCANGVSLGDVPQPCDVVRGGRDKVGGVCRERHIPDPALMATHHLLQTEVARVPDFDGAVSGGGCEQAVYYKGKKGRKMGDEAFDKESVGCSTEHRG